MIFILFVILSVIFILKANRFTIPFMVGVFLILSPILYFSDWVVIMIFIASLLSPIAYKFYLRREEKDLLNFKEKIYSVKGVIHSFDKVEQDKVSIGRILPTHPRELKHNHKMIKFSKEILRGVTLISGNTGSGKTSTLISLMRQKAESGQPILFIDMKGDKSVLDSLEQLANQLKIPYYEFSSRLCNFKYDYLENLNETGVVEALMNTRQWSMSGADAHYKSSTQLAIQNVVREYEKVKEEDYIKGLYHFALKYVPTSQEKDGHSTLIKQLELILTSKARELQEGDNEFSFEDDKPYIVAFSFVSANKSLANTMCSFIFQDLLDRGTRRSYPKGLFICVDEFGTIENPTLIKDLVEKGRSCGCETVFSILDINQLAITTNEFFVNALLGTINNFIIFAGATQTTANLLAGVQKFDGKDYTIMDLRKPFNNQPPTALVISKFPLVNKKGTQEVFKIQPYLHKVKTEVKVNDVPPVEVVEEIKEEKEEVKINIDDFL